MKLFLVQHAKAASKEVDPNRPLTSEGLRDIQKVAKFVRPLNLAVYSLWHSGKTRARQTAEILAEVIAVANETAAHDGLAPNDDVQAIKDIIASDQRDLMIVGHLPFMAKLASLLLTGSEFSGTVAFRQGGILCLSCENDEQWQIDWMVIPELLG
ncbi:MAG: phosphohistidine phosphatase SixA [Sedimentisphaerales bacterium]|nr:phosphohistidine phosphatase SixA [Sedimentisphaerales bacterium]